MTDFVDVHGFAGGLSLGTHMNGFTLRGKKETKGAFGAPNMEVNRHILGDQWETQAAPYEDWEPIDAPLVIGNPPCSGFSSMSTPSFRGVDSAANACMWGITEYAAKIVPEFFVFESVSQAYTQGRDLMQRLRTHLEELSGEKYHLTHVLHSAKSCGAPQLRQRYFFVAHRVPFGMEAPDIKVLSHAIDAIGDLVDLTETWDDQPVKLERSDLHPQHVARRGYRADGMVDGHFGRHGRHQERVAALDAMTSWNEGETMSVVLKRAYEEGKQIPEHWAHRIDSLVEKDFYLGFNQPMRIRRHHIAPVCTGGALDCQIHWASSRTLTHREVARLMGYPDEWRIFPLRDDKGLAATWGKGVTVDCGKWLGKWLKESIDGHPGSQVGETIGDRESLLDYRKHWKNFDVAA